MTELHNTEPAEPAERPKLTCPHCGGRTNVELVWEGSPYLQQQVVDGFYCNNSPICPAEWDADGNSR